jgi:hypothetical protein
MPGQPLPGKSFPYTIQSVDGTLRNGRLFAHKLSHSDKSGNFEKNSGLRPSNSFLEISYPNDEFVGALG